MKSLIVILSLLGLGSWAQATVVNCGTQDSATSCQSNDLPSSNIVNTNSTGVLPKSTIVISSPDNGSVEVSTSANSRALNTNVFVNNSGTAFNLNVDMSAKWNSDGNTNGLSSASDAGKTLIIADIVGNLLLDLSGYVGKPGLSSTEICAKKILSGDYGNSQLDLFKSRCIDGSTSNPCSDAKIRTACDAQDIQNLNSASGAVVGACPAGYNYMSALDDSPNPSIAVTRINPKTLRKCTRRSYQTSARTCRWRSITCQYNFTAGVSGDEGFAFKYPTGYNNPDAIISLSGQAFYHPYLCFAYDGSSCTSRGVSWGSNTPLANYTVTLKDMDYSNSTPPRCPVPVISESYKGAWYSGPMQSFNLFGTGYMTGPNFITTLTNGQYDSSSGVTYAPLATSIVIQNSRSIDASQQCLGTPYETDQGISTGATVPADTGYVERDQLCPTSADPTRPGYTDEGLVTDHNQTSPFTGLTGSTINPLVSETIADCTRSSCQNIGTSYSTSNTSKEAISLGAGERGSYGGSATFFIYDIIGSQKITYSHGSNGDNGSDNLLVNPVIKNCSAISGNGTSTPQALFHQTYWKLFSFTPSSVNYNNTFPTRTKDEAVTIFKKVSPGVQDLIKQATCSTCP